MFCVIILLSKFKNDTLRHMNKKLKNLLLILIILLPFFTSGCLSWLLPPKPDDYQKKKMQTIRLKYWRVYDGPDDFQDIIARYRRMHPNISIDYRKLRYDEFKQELLEAFATDRGPDIFSIHNTWVREYQEKNMIKAMPSYTTMVFPKVQGGIKKEVIYETKKQSSITPTQLKRSYVDVVYDDVVINVRSGNKYQQQIFGLPLSMDTLAMYYNVDLFNNAGITSPPQYWNREFQQDIKKLTKQNNKGEIIQAGVALGGSDNITRAFDILSVLMMQNGTDMMNGRSVTFQQIPDGFKDRGYYPGVDAVRFYTDFANPAKEVYSWNDSLENSEDLFVNNKLAIMFGYSYMLPSIKARAPKLNLAITKLPQIEGNLKLVNYANYWVEVVSNKSQYSEEAWDFLQYAAREENVKTYLNRTDKPTALRSLIDSQKDSETVGVFTQQSLTAESWYRGNDALSAEEIMLEIVKKVNVGQSKINDIINQAAQKIQQTIK